MTDVTSEKLYSKLEEINQIKRDLKSIMIDIGGYELFANDPKFELYPQILEQIHARIVTINNLLDLSIYGRSSVDIITTAKTTYKTIIPYLNELQYCRSRLIDNINTKGVIVDTDLTLREIVDKVLEISGGSSDSGEGSETTEVLESFYVLDDKLRVEVALKTNNYTDGSNSRKVFLNLVNVTDEVLVISDPVLSISLSCEDYTFSLAARIKDYVIEARDSMGAPLWFSSYDKVEDLADTVYSQWQEGKLHYSYRTIYKSEARSEHLTLEDKLDLYITLWQLSDYEYYLDIKAHTKNGESSVNLDNSYNICMTDPSGKTKYIMTIYWQGTVMDGTSTGGLFPIWYSDMRDLFLNFKTNPIIAEVTDEY